MQNLDLISLLITTYNRPDALALVLESCTQQTDTNFEIIIADDGSDDSTRALIEKMRQHTQLNLQHVWHEDQGFRAAAIRNRAIEQAAGDYLIFLDGDCILQEHFIARHRALAQAGTYVTGSRILLSQELTAQIMQYNLPLSKQSKYFWLSQRLARNINKILPLFFSLPAHWPRKVQQRFKWRGIKSCNMAAWRHDVLAIGGFDESFHGWGHEDADFAARLFNFGLRRKLGFWATEVFHLWHPEQARDRAHINSQKVVERLATGQIYAEHGI